MPHLLACFHEALRIFREFALTPYRPSLTSFTAAGVVLFRDIVEDIPIHLTRPKEQVVCLRKGSRLLVDMVGVRESVFIRKRA